MTTPSQKTWVCLAFVCLGCITGQAATWYAAANGNSTNGTLAAPWSVPYSVTNTNPHLQPGDTVIFKAGTFICTETNASAELGSILEFRKSGTSSAKITYQAHGLWGFAFDGGLYIPQTTSNLVIRYCRVFYSGSTNRERYSIYTHPPGIQHLGPGIDLLHNLVENTGHPGIGSWKTTRGKHIAGNIVRFVGNQDHTPGQVDGQRGAGMYLQNMDDSAEALIRGNISYYNNTEGMQAYGNRDIWGFRFANNIITSNSLGGILYHQDDYSSRGLTVQSNYMFNNAAGVRIGYPLGIGGHTNAIVTGNYIVDYSYPFYQADGWTNCIYTNNIGVNPYNRFMWSLETLSQVNAGDVTSHTINHNTYAMTNHFSTSPFAFQVASTNWAFTNWQAVVRGDTNSTYNLSVPSNVAIYVFAPSTDLNFVHVAVFNWTNASTTTVDLTPYFAAGTRIAIYDAQDIPNSYTNLSSSTTVPLNLTRTNRATMLGTFTQRADSWTGFDPRFRAFVIYRDTSQLGPPSRLQVAQ